LYHLTNAKSKLDNVLQKGLTKGISTFSNEAFFSIKKWDGKLTKTAHVIVNF